MGANTFVVVTGAAGHLGSHILPSLVSGGFEVRGTDRIDPAVLPEYVGFVKSDLTDPGSLREALDGADVVVHCASIHPWKEYSDAQYLDSNVKGTWNLYSQASSLGIESAVLTSSIAATGYPPHPADACPVREDHRFPVKDLYGLTKSFQETIATSYADRGLVHTIALRPPPFMPLPSLETGFLLTGTFSLVDDMASAHVAAVLTIAGRRESARSLEPFEAFNTTNQLPYTQRDVRSLGPDANVLSLVREHWPDAYDWLAERGYEGTRLMGLYDLSKARKLLGWRPEHNFEEWFSANAGPALTRPGSSEK
jgi:UDP-glucose 4-epimerase